MGHRPLRDGRAPLDPRRRAVLRRRDRERRRLRPRRPQRQRAPLAGRPATVRGSRCCGRRASGPVRRPGRAPVHGQPRGRAGSPRRSATATPSTSRCSARPGGRSSRCSPSPIPRWWWRRSSSPRTAAATWWCGSPRRTARGREGRLTAGFATSRASPRPTCWNGPVDRAGPPRRRGAGRRARAAPVPDLHPPAGPLALARHQLGAGQGGRRRRPRRRPRARTRRSGGRATAAASTALPRPRSGRRGPTRASRPGPADDDDLEVEQVDRGPDRDPERLDRGVEQRRRERVAVVERLGPDLRGERVLSSSSRMSNSDVSQPASTIDVATPRIERRPAYASAQPRRPHVQRAPPASTTT